MLNVPRSWKASFRSFACIGTMNRRRNASCLNSQHDRMLSPRGFARDWPPASVEQVSLLISRLVWLSTRCGLRQSALPQKSAGTTARAWKTQMTTRAADAAVRAPELHTRFRLTQEYKLIVAILRPCAFVVAGIHGFVLAVAEGADPGGINAQGGQRFTRRQRPAFAQ